MKKVIIFGTGGFAQIVYQYLKKVDPSELQVTAFSASESVIKEKTLLGLPVLPFEHIEKTYPSQQYQMFVAVGYSDMRK